MNDAGSDRPAGQGPSRRQVGAAALALGGALTLVSAGAHATPASPSPSEGSSPLTFTSRRHTTLRRGSPQRAGLLEKHLRALVKEAHTFTGPSPKYPYYPGAVVLAGRGGTVALEEAFGKAVRYRAYDEKKDEGVEFPADQQRPMTMDTVFDLASLSKLFTSILTVQQIERGALELEKPVATYLPEFGKAGKEKITLRQLLTHTSGFRPELPFYEESDRDKQLQLLWDEKPENEPGTAYVYSDLNLITMQLVLERVTKTPLDRLLRSRLTKPLGMSGTRYNPPASWKPRIAATEDQRKPWGKMDRGLVWGEVHDENSYSFGGVAGHAGVFSRAWDLAVLARTLLNGGAYGDTRILKPESVELMFTNFNTDFPGDDHGLGFELYQHWYMGAMATPYTAGHTGFTGTSIVLDPTTDSFLILLSNAVHPYRDWRSGSAPREAAGNHLARAVAVKPGDGRTAWYSGMQTASTGTLTLPALELKSAKARLSCSLWWDTEPEADYVYLEASTDGKKWEPVPFSTRRGHHGKGPEREERPQPHPEGSVSGFNERVWHQLQADLGSWRGKSVTLRLRYATDEKYVGRGAYADRLRVRDGSRDAFDDRRPSDAGRVKLQGWSVSRD